MIMMRPKAAQPQMKNDIVNLVGYPSTKRNLSNVALQMTSHHNCVIPVFLWSKKEQGLEVIRGCLDVVLKDTLSNLEKKLKQYNLKLVCREREMIPQVCS